MPFWATNILPSRRLHDDLVTSHLMKVIFWFIVHTVESVLGSHILCHLKFIIGLYQCLKTAETNRFLTSLPPVKWALTTSFTYFACRGMARGEREIGQWRERERNGVRGRWEFMGPRKMQKNRSSFRLKRINQPTRLATMGIYHKSVICAQVLHHIFHSSFTPAWTFIRVPVRFLALSVSSFSSLIPPPALAFPKHKHGGKRVELFPSCLLWLFTCLLLRLNNDLLEIRSRSFILHFNWQCTLSFWGLFVVIELKWQFYYPL